MRRLRIGFWLCLVACFVAMPAMGQDMSLSDVLLDGQGWELVASGYKFTEGPAVDPRGELYFTDVPNHRIYKLDAAGKVSVFVEESFSTNGLMFGPDGRLYGCQHGKQRIVAFDQSGRATTIVEGVESNDLVVRGDGAIYFTDPANHRVWYVNPQGEKRVVDEGIERPNGIILWPDQGTLVVADTLSQYLWTFRVEPDGSLKFKEPYYAARLVGGREGSGADGMTVDSAGRLYAATYAGLQVFDPTGRSCGVILKPQPAFLSNVVFAGPKLDTLYVTSTDKIYRRKTKVAGVRYPPR
jgi:sugar lactone lactonase YvrE